jgi:hypothetical protein
MYQLVSSYYYIIVVYSFIKIYWNWVIQNDT